jgi:hypothetical protein
MLTFQTRADYLSACTQVARYRNGSIASYMPPSKPYRWACAQCAKVLPDTESHALTRDDEMICYACATAHDVESLKSSDRFTGYLSNDCREWTTWTGDILGTVIQSNPCKLTRPSFTHDRQSYKSVRVRDVHGAQWHGRGSNGIVCTLRKVKG